MPVRADEPTPPEQDEGPVRNPVVLFLLGEGLLAANAGLATLDPKAYGILGALTFPLGVAELRGSNTTRWVALAAAEGLAAYNIAELDKDKYTDKDIFVANMIAWHAFIAMVGTTSWLKGDFDEPAKVSVHYDAYRHGGMLKVAYVF